MVAKTELMFLLFKRKLYYKTLRPLVQSPDFTQNETPDFDIKRGETGDSWRRTIISSRESYNLILGLLTGYIFRFTARWKPKLSKPAKHPNVNCDPG